MTVFKILSIDSGGIRGVIPATILVEIEQRTGRPISALFDLIAGTSTGGILALGLTRPGSDGKPCYRAEDGIRLYSQEGPRIFQRTLAREIATLTGITRVRYPVEPLETLFEEFLGDTRLNEALTDVLVTSYDIEERAPWIFRSRDSDIPMRQVARAAISAPTYFEPARITVSDGQTRTLVDGGVAVGNPTLSAYIDALGYATADQFLIVSLGSGRWKRRIPYDQARRWGAIGWVKPGIDLLLNGSEDITHHQMSQLMPHMEGVEPRYYRFQVDLKPENAPLDNVSPANIRVLCAEAQAYVERNDALLNQLCQQLTSTLEKV